MPKPIIAAMLSCEGYELTDREKKLFSKSNPLGITLFSRNIKDNVQVKKLVEDIKNTINREDVLIAVDEEGGRVSRLKELRGYSYLDQESLTKLPTKYSKTQATLISDELKNLGININYSPVVDKKNANHSKVLENRCFDGNDKKIILYAKALADTYMKMGVCSCIKHLPGHFSINNDPHLNVIESNISIDEIEKQIDYLKAFSNYPMAMTSHIKLNKIDAKNPTTTSKKVITEVIRNIIGFKGFLLSDAIDMHAIKGSILDKVKKSLNAGLDAVCYCGGKYNEMYEICDNKLFMSEKSLIRFANIKKVINNKKNIVDIDMLRASFLEDVKEYLNKEYSYDATEVLHQMQKKGDF